uniref:D-alanyl-D-alanine carboxypeptidase n=1 Tax=Halorussus amylolyticus TaxID=1126242 RepID=UPI00192F6E1F
MTDPIDHLTDLEGASVSALARDEDGTVLASHDPDRALAPASNTKLITSALALDALGPDYRFETRVEGYGSLESGPSDSRRDASRLDGDLVVVGSGHPDLDRDDLAELAGSVGAEFDEIRGDLLLDASRFGDGQLGPGWTWGDQRYYYGARSTAIALEKNLLTVEISGPEFESDSWGGGGA